MSELNGSIRIAGSDVPFETTISNNEIDLTDCVVTLVLKLPSGSTATQSTAAGNGLTRVTNLPSQQVVSGIISKTLTANAIGTVKFVFTIAVGGLTFKDLSYAGSFKVVAQ